jgi:hypothetical protein
MRIRLIAACVLAAAFAGASAPAIAQTTKSDGSNSDLIWNVIGCFGLLGLRGIWRDSDNDGYTDDPV